MILKAGTYKFNYDLDVSNIPTNTQPFNCILQYRFNDGNIYTDECSDFCITLNNNIICIEAWINRLDVGINLYSNPVPEESKDYYIDNWAMGYAPSVTFPDDIDVDDAFGTWFKPNTDYNLINTPTLTRKFSLLYLGETVKKIGSKVFKKLTTEEPTESIVGTWVFNDTVTEIPTQDKSDGVHPNCAKLFCVNFTHEGSYIGENTSCIGISQVSVDTSLGFQKSSAMFSSAYSYTDNTWTLDKYKTITITSNNSTNYSGEDTTESFLTWLKANATKL